MSLLTVKRLKVIRYELQGDYDDYGKWVEGGTKELPIKCSLQPYQKGITRINKPEGVKSEDLRIIFTKSEIKTADQYGRKQADIVLIKGQRYMAKAIQEFLDTGTSLDHYAVVLIKENKQEQWP